MKNWCKLQTAALNDPRLLKLPNDAQLTYYKLMHVAAQCDTQGDLIDDDGNPLDYDSLGIYLRQDPKATEMNIAALMRTGLITLSTNGAFSVNGYSAERDETAAERKREQRKRDNTNVTDMSRRDITNVTDESQVSHANVTPLEKNKRREEKEKELEEKKEVFAQSANAPDLKKVSQPTNLKTEAEQKRGLFFAKIAEICQIPKDSKIHARQINAAAVWFASKSIESPRLDEFLVWWFANDWRGRKSEYPKPDQIVSEWPKFESGHKIIVDQRPNYSIKTKGEIQMSNLRAGLASFLEDS